MGELYDTDILDWSKQQAALLRRVAAGERVNGADWPNIIEELESVGREQLHAVESLLLQALLHHLKAEAWPGSRDRAHWLSEARLARINAADRFAPSMRQRVDVARIYSKALRAMPDSVADQPALPVAAVCPFTLDQLLTVA